MTSNHVSQNLGSNIVDLKRTLDHPSTKLLEYQRELIILPNIWGLIRRISPHVEDLLPWSTSVVDCSITYSLKMFRDTRILLMRWGFVTRLQAACNRGKINMVAFQGQKIRWSTRTKCPRHRVKSNQDKLNKSAAFNYFSFNAYLSRLPLIFHKHFKTRWRWKWRNTTA
jgi:hypothetical protein